MLCYFLIKNTAFSALTYIMGGEEEIINFFVLDATFCGSNIFFCVGIIFYRQKKEKEKYEMGTVIRAKRTGMNRFGTSVLKGKLREVLPIEVSCEADRITENLRADERIEEIRLRSGRRTYLTVSSQGAKRNIALDAVMSEAELSGVLDRMCDGSLYAYSESIIKGYLTIGDGIRVGVCGRASVEDGRILGIYNVSALNIRLPCGTVGLDGSFVKIVRESLKKGEGVLIYSPPAQGKTTMLRSLIKLLAGGENPLRVAAVDTRDELDAAYPEQEMCLDMLTGYPKADGIRIATAFMNPQVVVCDEIGDVKEAEAIAEAQNCGVPLVATAHGSDARSILRRKGMRRLHEVGAFGIYVGIAICSNGAFEYRIQRREEISLEDNGDNTPLL